MPSPEERLDRDAYDRVAGQRSAARSGCFKQEESFLDELLCGLPPGSPTLDAGCGSGRPMAGAGLVGVHRVLGVEQSAALLALARQRLPTERFELCALTDYPFAKRCRGSSAGTRCFTFRARRMDRF